MQARFPGIDTVLQAGLLGQAARHVFALGGGKRAQHVAGGEFIQRIPIAAVRISGIDAHCMHSFSACRPRRTQAFTLPSGAPSRAAISLCEQPST
ncbi:hypothetical protein D3C87_1263570 [compost metagenome]